MLMWTYYGPFFNCCLISLFPLPPCLCVLSTQLPLPVYSSPTPSAHPSCPCPLPFLLPLSAPEICTMSLEGNTGQRACDVGLQPPPHLDTRMLGLYADGDNVYRHPVTHSRVHPGTRREVPQHIACSFCNCLLQVIGWTQRGHTPQFKKRVHPNPLSAPPLEQGTHPSCAPLPGGEQGFTVR